MLQLFASAFESCQASHIRILLRGLHAVIELHRERRLDDSKIISALVSRELVTVLFC